MTCSSLEAVLQRALDAHRGGRLEEAHALYAEAQVLAPADAQVLYLSGVLEFQRGHLNTALEFFEQSLALDATCLGAHIGRGNALLELREPAAALESYGAALHLAPTSVDAHFNRGNALLDLGRHAEAIASFERASELHPTFAPALNNKGLALAGQGQIEGALQCFKAALAQDPAYVDAWLSLGNAQTQLADFRGAKSSYVHALSLSPELPSAWLGLGNALAQLHDFAGARSNLERAVALAPQNPDAHCNLANVLAEQGELAQAVTGYRRALTLDPTFEPAAFNWGNACLRANDLEGAVAAFERATTLAPEHAEAHSNLGLTQTRRMRCEAAKRSLDRALSLKPDFARAHVNRALLALLTGDYRRGWSEYEWRWRLSDTSFVTQRRQSAAPLWLGVESLAGKTLLLYAEQGFGDTLQFCRYAPLAAEAGARVILEVPAPLTELMRTLPGVQQICAPGTHQGHDLLAPLMSLPLAFKTTLADIPAKMPYLAADAGRIEHFTALLGPKRRPRVGLVWSGGIRSRDVEPWSVDERRNVRLETLLGALSPELEYVSLQKGPAESELRSATPAVAVHDLAAHLRDFADTAAALHQVDLLISVDTSVAHLAGALGKPTWLLNRFDTCWRWLLDRDDSPWYPSMRLFRQRNLGDWSHPIAAIAAGLRSRF